MKMKEHYDETTGALHMIIAEKTLQPKKSSTTLRSKRIDKELHVIMKKKLIERKLSKAKKFLLEPPNADTLLM
jgi:hypothetical protein